MLLAATASAFLFRASVPPWVFMWLVAAGVFVGVKAMSLSGVRLLAAPVSRRVLYLVAWPGLDAHAFLDRERHVAAPGGHELATAVVRLLVGLVLLFVGVRLLPESWPLARGWTGMVGIVLVLHFGVFDAVSVALRARGVDAKPLMRSPILSSGLREFWGRRWNTAFRDLTHRFVFQPLAHRVGGRVALAAVFLLSGLVHDLVISVPARGGYGGPTLFFVIQGALVLTERTAVGRRLGMGQGIRGRLFTLGSLVATAGLLFHRPFVEHVMLPMLDAIGATS